MKILGRLVCVLLLVGCSAEDSLDDSPTEAEQGVSLWARYRLLSGLDSNKCLSVARASQANRTNVRLWDCGFDAAQVFRKEVVDSTRRTFRFVLEASVNKGPKKCVDIDNAGTADHTNVQLYECNGSAAQTFSSEYAGSQLEYITSAVDGRKVLDVHDGRTANGTNIQLYTMKNVLGQKWFLQPYPMPLVARLVAECDGGANCTSYHARWKGPNGAWCMCRS